MEIIIDKIKLQFIQLITVKKLMIVWKNQRQCQGAWSGQEICQATIDQILKIIDIFKILQQ